MLLKEKFAIYGAAIFDALYRFGFVIQILFLLIFKPDSVGVLILVNSGLVVGKTLSNLGFSRNRFRHLIIAADQVMMLSLKVLMYRQLCLMTPILFLGFSVGSFFEPYLLLIMGLGILFGFIDFIVAIHVARRDVDTVRSFAISFVFLETTVFCFLFLFLGDVLISKSIAYAVSICCASIYSFRNIFCRNTPRLKVRFLLSFRSLPVDLYGGLFSISLLLRAHVFPLVMYGRFDNNMIASFGLLNQAGLLLIFVLRSYMNSHQRQLISFFDGSSGPKALARVYGVYFSLMFLFVMLIGASAILLDIIFADYNSLEFLPTVIILFILTSLYIAFNDFLIFAKLTGTLFTAGMLSLLLFFCVYLLDKSWVGFPSQWYLETLAFSMLPTVTLVVSHFYKLLRNSGHKEFD